MRSRRLKQGLTQSVVEHHFSHWEAFWNYLVFYIRPHGHCRFLWVWIPDGCLSLILLIVVHKSWGGETSWSAQEIEAKTKAFTLMIPSFSVEIPIRNFRSYEASIRDYDDMAMIFGSDRRFHLSSSNEPTAID